MLNKKEKIRRKINNFLFDHYILKESLDIAWIVFISLITAFIFAFAFVCFILPAPDTDEMTIVTGGVSGLSQNLALILNLNGIELGKNSIQAIGYLVFNIPILVFGFFKVGKKFSLASAFNVVISSILISVLSNAEFTADIAKSDFFVNSPLTRILVGGLMVGLSSSLAFKSNISCGGVDVITYYFSVRKSTSVGKFCILFNTCIVSAYAILLMVNNPSSWTDGIVSVIASVLYLFIVAVVTDFINLRNKKTQIQIITAEEHMGHILISNFPHSCTEVKGKGVYANSDKYIIWMIISNVEVKKVVDLCRKVDPHAFITVTSLVQVYGNFFIKPVE